MCTMHLTIMSGKMARCDSHRCCPLCLYSEKGQPSTRVRSSMVAYHGKIFNTVLHCRRLYTRIPRCTISEHAQIPLNHYHNARVEYNHFDQLQGVVDYDWSGLFVRSKLRHSHSYRFSTYKIANSTCSLCEGVQVCLLFSFSCSSDLFDSTQKPFSNWLNLPSIFHLLKGMP